MVVPRPTSTRRSRLLRRLVPVLGLAAVAFLGGVVVGAGHEPAERTVTNNFVEAWERGDYAAMHALLTPEAQRSTSVARFARAYRRAATTATTAAWPPRACPSRAKAPSWSHSRAHADLGRDREDR